ncbi:MAG: PilZ domain-containing protein [Candidatus Manganitrophus sp.]|nr:PilZ domain-containing protein [Candidatus Manganitrophus sp.]
MENSPDKRKSSRLEGVTFPVEYALSNQHRFQRARAMSIGEAGFMLLLEEPLSMGTPLQVKLYLPKTLFPFSNWQTIPLEAKVVRVDSQTSQDGYYRHGLLITKISDQDGLTLKRYVHLSHWMKEKIQS